MPRIRRILLALGWLAVAAVISLGAAGLVGAANQPPGTAARAELTAAGDAAIEPGLAAVEAQLAQLSDDVTELGTLARGALAAMAGGEAEADTLDQAITDGTDAIEQIRATVGDLHGQLAALPGIGPRQDLVLSPETLARYARAEAAIDITNELPFAWARLADGSLSASNLSTLLTGHDTLAGEAATLGRAGSYAEALAKLTEAEDTLTRAAALRDRLRNTVDVAVLSEWVDRNKAYDAVLRRLWEALIASGGKVDDAVRQAIADEQNARAILPPDTRALVVILGEIGRGGLNQAVITIEQARGELDQAIAAMEAASGRTPNGSDVPTVTPPP